MCRSIKRLYFKDQHPTEEEVIAASLQFVRKVAGMRTPSKINTSVFEKGVEEVTWSVKKLLQTLK